jgi:MmyB-like transcription regulator ligand binding domain
VGDQVPHRACGPGHRGLSGYPPATADRRAADTVRASSIPAATPNTIVAASHPSVIASACPETADAEARRPASSVRNRLPNVATPTACPSWMVVVSSPLASAAWCSVARLRSAYGLHVGDPDWEEDIRRLASMSREFAELWARHEVADAEPRTLTYLHPRAGSLSFAVTELDVPQMPEARIVVYTPRDEQTRAKLPLTRRTPATAEVMA